MWLKMFKNEIKNLKFYILIGISVIIVSFTSGLIALGKLTIEDGFFEYFTAFLFLIISIVFLMLFSRTKRLINLIFCLVFFFGFGEEISWGQRIFNFKPPESVLKNNVQHEFNIHNLRFFTSYNADKKIKEGLGRYINVYMLFKIFWIGYGILLPLISLLYYGFYKNDNVIGLKLPPISIGLLFIFNFIIFKILLKATLLKYPHLNIGECYEFNEAFIFLLIGLFFIINQSGIHFPKFTKT